MREILFRGKRKDNGEWVEGRIISDDVIIPKGQVYYISDNVLDSDIYAHIVVPETVGQYTGLTDKNGRKIFEGDIIRYADVYEYECYLESLEYPEEYDGVDFSDMWTVDEVVYCIANGYPAFDLSKHDFETNGLSALYESRQFYFEVIGNIHENPEMLEVSK